MAGIIMGVAGALGGLVSAFGGGMAASRARARQKKLMKEKD